MRTDKFTDIKSLWSYIKKQGCQKYPTIANDKIGNVWKWERYYQKWLISYPRRLAVCRTQWLHCDWLWHINASRTSTHREADPSFAQQIIDGTSVWQEENFAWLQFVYTIPKIPAGTSLEAEGRNDLANPFHIFSRKWDCSLVCQICLRLVKFTQMTDSHHYFELNSSVLKSTDVESIVMRWIINQQILIKTPAH